MRNLFCPGTVKILQNVHAKAKTFEAALNSKNWLPKFENSPWRRLEQSQNDQAMIKLTGLDN